MLTRRKFLQRSAAMLGALCSSQVNAMPAVKIMPLGDSITSGYGHEGGYRLRLGERIAEATYDATFVGSLENGPKTLASRKHEGHDGWTIPQLAAQLDGWLRAYEPDIILLHMGTNDLWELYDVPTTLNNLGLLIDQICRQRPHSLLIVAAIIPANLEPEYDARVRAYADAIPDLVWNKVALGYPLTLADMRNLGVQTEDGVHPSAAGYDLLGEKWWLSMQGL